MATKIQVTFDCADPDRLARFWADALGYEFEKPPAGYDSWEAYWGDRGVPEDELDDASSVVDPAGAGPRIFFQKVPEGKVVKNRLHLDLDARGGRDVPLALGKERINAEADRLARVGATKLHAMEEGGGYFVVMQDPEGNEFCVH